MKKIGRRRCVPLRVPVRTLTEHCSRAVDSTLSSVESYTCIPEGRISKLCEPSVPEFASRGKRRIASSPAPSLSLLNVGRSSGIPSCRPLSGPRKERGCYAYCSRLSRQAEALIFFVHYVKDLFFVFPDARSTRPLLLLSGIFLILQRQTKIKKL